MRWDIAAFFGISTAVVLGALLAVFVKTIFVGSRDESTEKLLNPPSRSPTNMPSLDPTAFPTGWPSMNPTESSSPSSIPSSSPSLSPSAAPSHSPSAAPSPSPSAAPSPSPSSEPSTYPSASPSTQPTSNPSSTPSSEPSQNPTISTSPSSQPSTQPTLSTSPSSWPSLVPSTSAEPSSFPTTIPSLSPTKVVITTIVLNGGKDQSMKNNMAMIGGSYVFVLASVAFCLYKKNKKARKGEDASFISSESHESNFDVEGGILGIAPLPPPVVEKATAKSVSRRILSPLKSFSSIRSLSPFKSFPSLRGKKLVAGSSVSISSGDSDVIPAIQESCSIDSSDTEKQLGSKDNLDALMKSSSLPDEQDTQKISGKLYTSSHPSRTKASAPRDSLDALVENVKAHNEIGQMGSDRSFAIEQGSLRCYASTEQESTGRRRTSSPSVDAGNLYHIGSSSKLPRLVYEEQLICTSKTADFSFRDIFFDPENEIYECRVPSGRLGIVVDETGLGPRVQTVDKMSTLYGKISVGDIIIAVDEVDLTGAKPDTFWQHVSRKANKNERCIVVLKI